LKVASFFEQDFLNDMDQLNVRRADALTRVSEYVPEIINFVQEIVSNGYAYESSGDVYFDVAQFLKDGYTYKKCSPPLSEVDLAALLNEGEGSLFTGSKRDARDFALWKTSKVIIYFFLRKTSNTTKLLIFL
jgi:cysteinyl-tRNA synthetase